MFNPLKKINADLDSLSTDVQALINATAGAADDKVAAARKRLGALIHEGEVVYDKIERGTTNTVKRANEVVHNNPIKALGVALGVGVALGAVMYRRSR